MSKVTENDDRRARIDEVCRRGIPNADETNAYNRSRQSEKEECEPLIGPPKGQRLSLSEIAPEKAENSQQGGPGGRKDEASYDTVPGAFQRILVDCKRP